jgi:hypothetical protein
MCGGMADESGDGKGKTGARSRRQARRVAMAGVVVVMVSHVLQGDHPARAQTGGPPGCRLEPGPGPMRCADPNDPRSVSSLKHALFAFATLPVAAGKGGDPVCLLYKPMQMLQGYGMAISPAASPGYPARQPSYAFLSYEVDLEARQMTITELRAADGTAVKPGLKLKLYDVPQHGWPCRPLNWSMLLGNTEIDPADVPDRR